MISYYLIYENRRLASLCRVIDLAELKCETGRKLGGKGTDGRFYNGGNEKIQLFNE